MDGDINFAISFWPKVRLTDAIYQNQTKQNKGLWVA